ATFAALQAGLGKGLRVDELVERADLRRREHVLQKQVTAQVEEVFLDVVHGRSLAGKTRATQVGAAPESKRGATHLMRKGSRVQRFTRLATLVLWGALLGSAPTWSAAATPAALQDPAALKEKAPDTFKVKFDTTQGVFLAEVTRAWSPNGA